MSITRLSEHLSNYITKDLNYDEDKKELVIYGIETALLAIIGFLALLFVAFLFQAILSTAIAAIFGGTLRRLSGGAHFNTPFKCLTFGTVVYSFLGVLSKELVLHNLVNTTILEITLLICLIIVTLLAPVDCKAKPIHSKSFKTKLKATSIFLIILTFILIIFINNPILVSGAVMGIGYQTITLLPVFNPKKGGV